MTYTKTSTKTPLAVRRMIQTIECGTRVRVIESGDTGEIRAWRSAGPCELIVLMDGSGERVYLSPMDVELEFCEVTIGEADAHGIDTSLDAIAGYIVEGKDAEPLIIRDPHAYAVAIVARDAARKKTGAGRIRNIYAGGWILEGAY